MNDTPGFLDRSKQPAIQAAIAKDAVKALVMPVLPRAARSNEVRLDMMRAQPRRDLLRNKLWAIVTLHIGRSPTLCKETLEHLDHIPRGDRPGAGDGQPLTRILVEHRQAFQPSPIDGLIVDEVIAPDMIRIRCAGRRGCADAQRPPLARFLDHLEACALPEAAHRLATHSPLFALQQGENLAISEPWIAVREGD